MDNITPNSTEAQKASPRKVNRERRPKAANVKGGLAEFTENLVKVKVETRVKGRGANLAQELHLIGGPNHEVSAVSTEGTSPAFKDS